LRATTDRHPAGEGCPLVLGSASVKGVVLKRGDGAELEVCLASAPGDTSMGWIVRGRLAEVPLDAEWFDNATDDHGDYRSKRRTLSRSAYQRQPSGGASSCARTSSSTAKGRNVGVSTRTPGRSRRADFRSWWKVAHCS